MSTYYQYRDVKVAMAHKLMKMDSGWKVYGYKPNESDMMVDYWSPADWGGIAEKNGYVLCVNVNFSAERKEEREYNLDNANVQNADTMEKIKKLQQMTVARGASEAEEKSASEMIQKLKNKINENQKNSEKYIVTGYIPAHMANPPRMNWHIEKDGMIIAKGNGILKFAAISNYYKYDSYKKDLESFKADKKSYAEKSARDLFESGHYDSLEKARKSVEYDIDTLEKDSKLVDKFEELINKIDTTCGGLLGEGDGTYYEKVKVTEYKKENKPIEDENGSIKEGQCFIVKTSFNYGHNKGYVYRIHEKEFHGNKSFCAIKLNGKLTKECTGTANESNYWYIHDVEKFNKWFDKKSLAWCHIEEVKTPYEVEKVVKRTVKAEKKQNSKVTPATETKSVKGDYTYKVIEDVDTRTNEPIYVVKIAEKLNREEYLKVNEYIRSLGGYYSRFKHGFLFKENPEEKLNK